MWKFENLKVWKFENEKQRSVSAAADQTAEDGKQCPLIACQNCCRLEVASFRRQGANDKRTN